MRWLLVVAPQWEKKGYRQKTALKTRTARLVGCAIYTFRIRSSAFWDLRGREGKKKTHPQARLLDPVTSALAFHLLAAVQFALQINQREFSFAAGKVFRFTGILRAPGLSMWPCTRNLGWGTEDACDPENMHKLQSLGGALESLMNTAKLYFFDCSLFLIWVDLLQVGCSMVALSHIFAAPISVLWVWLEKSNWKLDVRNIFPLSTTRDAVTTKPKIIGSFSGLLPTQVCCGRFPCSWVLRLCVSSCNGFVHLGQKKK